MDLIVRTRSIPDLNDIDYAMSLGINIIHSSDYAPYFLAPFEDRQAIEQLPFITGIYEGREGKYEEIGEFLVEIRIDSDIWRRNLLKRKGLTGWGAKIAILDSGVPKNSSPVDAQDFTGTGLQDFCGHASLVYQVIKELAPGAELYFAKIGNDKPLETAALRAVEWAAKRADIINISSGFGAGCKGNCTLAQVINAIVMATSCAVVVAAGNDGRMGDNTINCPGCAINAVTVGAVDSEHKLADYSSRGKPGTKKPNILAPGCLISGDCCFTGTSYAAPFISGIIGATRNRFNTAQESVQCIYNTATDLGLPTNHQGFGLVDPKKYLEVVNDGRSSSRGQGQRQN